MAVLSFLVGLVTLGIFIAPLLAGLAILMMWNRDGAKRDVAQRHKIILIGAILLVLLASLFPPYWDGKLDAEGNLVGRSTKWEFNRHLIDLVESITQGHPPEMIEYMPRHDILGIEILGILALAGVAYLMTKKRPGS